MASPDEFLFEYAVIRYVPRIDREEFVNIGLLMMCKRQRWFYSKIELNEARLKIFDPYINLNKLANQAQMFENSEVPFKDSPVEERYRWFTAVKNAMLQVSPSHPGLVADAMANTKEEAVEILNKEFNRLFKELIRI